MRFQGKITEWRDEQGFGFVTQNGDGKRIFLHIKSFSRRGRRPALHDSVTYAVAVDAKGRASAEQVAFAGERAEKMQAVRGPDSAMPLWFAALFALAILALVVLGVFRWYVLAFYAAVNLLTFVRYWLDKEAARKAERRTPEASLHLLALFGGWPGALLAQRMFRHKSIKRSFQQTYWATVVLHCAALAWLLTPYGAVALNLLNGHIG
jgi:uncharacterized membrane protein YsdA (DUF1294 family)/cold shock CspA family protein